MLNNFTKLFIFLLFFVFISKVHATEKKLNLQEDSKVVIKGEKQSLEISDLPLSQYKYDDLSFFTKNFQPKKELLSLLENSDILMELDNNTVALDFSYEFQ